MRKSRVSIAFCGRFARLQCGRIYKDAEICILVFVLKRTQIVLQCGRIYKDAEISRAELKLAMQNSLQCGRIYKDAEISRRTTFVTFSIAAFNVAASIKMRKCRRLRLRRHREPLPSMWPHL